MLVVALFDTEPESDQMYPDVYSVIATGFLSEWDVNEFSCRFQGSDI